MITFLSLHPVLLTLTRSHLSPIPSTIRQTVLAGHPSPPILAKLPSLSLFLPHDGGMIFVDLLVRARPKWILEVLELGRWREEVWREAFEARFLPSWKRFKVEGDTWRAIFLRWGLRSASLFIQRLNGQCSTLGRLEHRNIGCTHEESWTVSKSDDLIKTLLTRTSAFHHTQSEWLGKYQPHLLSLI